MAAEVHALIYAFDPAYRVTEVLEEMLGLKL